MKPAQKEVAIGDRKFTVRELTTADIRAWLKSRTDTNGEIDIVGVLMFEDFAFDDLRAMTTATDDDLSAMRPSEIRTLADAAIEMNSDFFVLRRRLLAVPLAANAVEQSNDRTSNAPLPH